MTHYEFDQEVRRRMPELESRFRNGLDPDEEQRFFVGKMKPEDAVEYAERLKRYVEIQIAEETGYGK